MLNILLLPRPFLVAVAFLPPLFGGSRDPRTTSTGTGTGTGTGMASSLGGYTASTHRHRPHARLDKTQLEHARTNGQLTRANSGLAAGVSAGTGVLHEGVSAAPLDDDDNR